MEEPKSKYSVATLQYCPVNDTYTFENCGSETTEEIRGWEDGAATHSNIYRKEELDWNMVGVLFESL